MSDFFQRYHQNRGVRFELGCSVIGFEGAGGHITSVRLADGRIVECDTAVVGIGARPNDDIARECGLATAGGVVVDQDSRSVTDPAVFAIGDVARRPVPIYGRVFRLESVPNALEQAKQAASAITGRTRPPDECPWQWSDQYELKLQIAGYPFDADGVLLRGDPATEKFTVFHMKGDLVQSVEAVNSPAEFMIGKQLILGRKPVSVAKLIDQNIPMKSVAA